jgi:hypothetical protein
MSWFTSEPDPIVISGSAYFETRPNPDDPETDQLRKRTVIQREYRGVTLAKANAMVIEYPQITEESTITRNAKIIPAYGMIVYETEDKVTSDWLNEPGSIGTV